MELGLSTRHDAPHGFRICVLASGSAGNCTLLLDGEQIVFIDVGLSAKTIVEASRRLGVALAHPRYRLAEEKTACAPLLKPVAALLTHTHADHINNGGLSLLPHNDVTLFAHASHLAALNGHQHISKLKDMRRVEQFRCAPFQLTSRTFAHPLVLSHDCSHTFGFVFVHKAGRGREHKFSYVADLGAFDDDLVEALADSEVLAIEFNHDEHMERMSGRSPATIERVLGPYGHLSNRDAAALLEKVIRRSHPKRRPRDIILLHLSRDCNTPRHALREAHAALARCGCNSRVLVARQDEPLQPISLLDGGCRV
ncbi:MAG: MBL fold metallo-hydrolase [Candidatus Sumerlaeaceae bacterium]|jgi:phosphoribosyl 1,2-cyclic phosphodiesterase